MYARMMKGLTGAALLAASACTGGSGDEGPQGSSEGGDAQATSASADAAAGSGGTADASSPAADPDDLGRVWVITREPDMAYRVNSDLVVTGEVELAGVASDVEVVDGVLWYVLEFGDALHYVDPTTGESGTIDFSQDSTVNELAFADGLLWLGDGGAGVLWNVDPSSREVVAGVRFDDRSGDVDNRYRIVVDAEAGRLWLAALFGDPDLLGFGTEALEIELEGSGGDGVTGITTGEGALWTVSRFDGMLRRFDSDTLELIDSAELNVDLSGMPSNVAVAGGKLWVAAGTGGNADFNQPVQPGVYPVDAETLEVELRIEIAAPRSVRADAGAVWVAAADEGVAIIDTATGEVGATVDLPAGRALDVAFARSGGGSGLAEARSPIEVDDIVAPPPDTACEVSTFPPANPFDPYTATGSATFTWADGSLSLDELACETFFDAQGDAMGYGVSFADGTDETSNQVSFELQEFSGDGNYDGSGSLVFDVDGLDQAGAYGLDLQVTVSDGGRSGVVRSDSVELDYTCGSDARIQPGGGAPVDAPEPGQAHVIREDGRVHLFEGITCSVTPVRDTLEVTVDRNNTDAFSFRVSADAALEGTHAGSLSYNYYWLGLTSLTSGEVTFSCGPEGDRGTFISGSSAIEQLEARFVCPLQSE